MCEFFGVGAGVVGDDLAGAEELVFVDEKALEADGAAGVDFVGADADLSAEVVAEAVAKARAAVPKDIPQIGDQQEVELGGDSRTGRF